MSVSASPGAKAAAALATGVRAPQPNTDTAGMTRLLDRLEGKELIRRRRHP